MTATPTVLTSEDYEEVARIAETLPFNDEMILAQLQETVKWAVKSNASLANDGAMAYLDPKAEAIWDEAVKTAFQKWLTNR